MPVVARRRQEPVERNVFGSWRERGNDRRKIGSAHRCPPSVFSRSKNSVSIRTPDRASRHGTEGSSANRANFSSALMLDGANFGCDYIALAVNGCECQKFCIRLLKSKIAKTRSIRA